MRNRLLRCIPGVLLGVLLFDLSHAIARGGRTNWLTVAVLALLTAAALLVHRRTTH
ncbi:MAG: hypothetical protein H0T54_06145 [Geodermatophilaceae bacterium]|nr:hypothetical protein [Geodermatophilaceae bacterium]